MGLEQYIGTFVITKEPLPNNHRGQGMIPIDTVLLIQEMVGNQHFNLVWTNGKRAANQIHYKKVYSI